MAAYGVITLIISMLGAFKRRINMQNAKVKLVLIVKNVEEHAEYIVRTVIKEEFASKVMSGSNIAIIDMSSTDSTLNILSRLENDYECLDLLNQDERNRIFDDF
jgi:hypothetical protein